MLYKEVLHQLLLKRLARQSRLVAPKPMSLKKHSVPESIVRSDIVKIPSSSPTMLAMQFDNHRARYLDQGYVPVTVSQGKWLNSAFCKYILMSDKIETLNVGDTILYNPLEVAIGANGDVYQTVRPTTIYIHSADAWHCVTLK